MISRCLPRRSVVLELRSGLQYVAARNHQATAGRGVFDRVADLVTVLVDGLSVSLEILAAQIAEGRVETDFRMKMAVEMIKAAGIGVKTLLRMAQMPLAEYGGLITVRLKQLGEGHQPVVHRGRERCDPVDVVVGAGQDRRAAGGADGVGAEAVVEAHSTICNPVKVRRTVDAAPIAAHGMRRMVVGHDKQNIWSIVSHINTDN